MNTTGLAMTVTDELLAELEHRHMSDPKGAIPVFCSDIAALTAELRRLRAENAEMEQSLAESRANDQAAMGWLTSLRWASGDRGERMLPELVAHIEGLAKDAGRYRWLQKASPYMHKKIRDLAITDGGDVFYFHKDKYDAAIDTAMATQ